MIAAASENDSVVGRLCGFAQAEADRDDIRTGLLVADPSSKGREGLLRDRVVESRRYVPPPFGSCSRARASRSSHLVVLFLLAVCEVDNPDGKPQHAPLDRRERPQSLLVHAWQLPPRLHRDAPGPEYRDADLLHLVQVSHCPVDDQPHKSALECDPRQAASPERRGKRALAIHD